MNMHLILSGSNRITNTKIKELVDLKNETIYFDLNFSTIKDILKEATYVSLFKDKKNIIAFNTQQLNDKSYPDDLNLLAEYSENENEETTIIFVSSEKCSLKNPVYSILKKTNNIYDFLKVKTDINKDIQDYCIKNKYSIGTQAINELKKHLNNNYDLIMNELDKLFLFYDSPQEIKPEAITKNCSKVADDNNFKFVDLVVGKKYKSSFEYLDELLVNKVEPLNLFSLLLREFRIMFLFKTCEKYNVSSNDIIKRYNLKEWQIDKAYRNASNYKYEELKKIMLLFSTYDYKFKAGKVLKDNFLNVFLLELFS